MLLRHLDVLLQWIHRETVAETVRPLLLLAILNSMGTDNNINEFCICPYKITEFNNSIVEHNALN